MPERSLKTLFFHFLSNQYFLKKLTAKQFFLKKFVLSLAQLQIRHRIQIPACTRALLIFIVRRRADHRLSGHESAHVGASGDAAQRRPAPRRRRPLHRPGRGPDGRARRGRPRAVAQDGPLRGGWIVGVPGHARAAGRCGPECTGSVGQLTLPIPCRGAPGTVE